VVPNLFRAKGKKNVPTFHVAGKFSRRGGGGQIEIFPALAVDPPTRRLLACQFLGEQIFLAGEQILAHE